MARLDRGIFFVAATEDCPLKADNDESCKGRTGA
jgi:hypothetical protein